MLNDITIQGRICNDVTLRYTQSQKPVASFTLAVERDFAPTGEKKETDFPHITAWNNLATFCDKYLSKGNMIIVRGRLQSREWTDKHDQKRTEWEIVADNIYFCESKKSEQKPVNVSYDEPTKSAFTEMADSDGELPF